MSSQKSFSGWTIEAALDKAARAYDKAPAELNYEVLAGGSGGFALIRVVEGAAAAAVPTAADEQRTGSKGAHGEGSDETASAERAATASDRRGAGGEASSGEAPSGGRRAEGRGKGKKRHEGSKRDEGSKRNAERGGPESTPEMPSVPREGPTHVAMHVGEGTELSEIGEDAHEVVRDLLTGMGFGMDVTLTEEAEVIRFDLDAGVYHDALVANDLELLEALEHLVDKIVNFDAPDRRKRVILDVAGLKRGLDLELQDSAREAAGRARSEGRTVKIGPMDARSRRLAHLAVRDVDGVTSRSEGEGAFRRVCIVPDRGGSDESGSQEASDDG